MADGKKCWKIVSEAAVAGRTVIQVGGELYAQQEASDDEIEKSAIYRVKWQLERQYDVQVCGPDCPRAYMDKRTEFLKIPFEELIFRDGECIGLCHEECIMLFADEKTHRQKKFLGEFPTGPDRGFDVYDHYFLKRS